MNPSVPNSPMASLLMSLGGSIDFSRLELSNDGASGLSDFSQLLNGMQLSELPDSLDGQLPELSTSLSAAMPEGQNLPLGLPLTALSDDEGGEIGSLPELSSAQSMLSSEDVAEVSSDTLMTQIREGREIRVRYTEQQPDTEPVGSVGAVADADAVDSPFVPVTARPQNLSEKSATDTMNDASVTSLAAARTQSSSDVRQPNGQRTGSRLNDGNLSAGLNDALPGDSEVDSEVSELFRPVTADEDGPSGPGLRDTLMPSQGTVSGPPVQAAANPAAAVNLTVASAAQSAEAAASDALKDASEAGEYSAEEGFEQKLQRQLKERLDFGQDRREWTPALGARLVTMVANDVQHARIQLDPPELGSLEIKMQVQQDQASVQVNAQSHQVKDVLDNGAQRLRDALAAEGIELSEFSVAADGGRQGDEGSSDGQGSGGFAGDGSVEGDELTEAQPAHVAAPDALLDTFA